MPRPPAPPVRPVSSKGPSGALIGTVVVLVVALIGALVFWAATRGQDLEATGTSSTLPQGGGIAIGADADVPQIHIYADPQCPWCGVLEKSMGDALADKVESGEIGLTITLMSFLDGQIPGQNSVRAVNAALCADESGVFLPFYQQMYATQPAEGAGWSDEQLVALGEQAGVSDTEAFASCVADLPHVDYVEAMQARANQDGISGTPRMFVDGAQITDEEMSGLMQDASTLDAVIANHAS